MGNSLLAVRGINHKYIVVGCDYIEDGKCLYNRCHLIGRQLYVKFLIRTVSNLNKHPRFRSQE